MNASPPLLPVFVARGRWVVLDVELADALGLRVEQLRRLCERHLDGSFNDFVFSLPTWEIVMIWPDAMDRQAGVAREPHRVFTECGVALVAMLLRKQRPREMLAEVMRVFSSTVPSR